MPWPEHVKGKLFCIDLLVTGIFYEDIWYIMIYPSCKASSFRSQLQHAVAGIPGHCWWGQAGPAQPAATCRNWWTITFSGWTIIIQNHHVRCLASQNRRFPVVLYDGFVMFYISVSHSQSVQKYFLALKSLLKNIGWVPTVGENLEDGGSWFSWMRPWNYWKKAVAMCMFTNCQVKVQWSSGFGSKKEIINISIHNSI